MRTAAELGDVWGELDRETAAVVAAERLVRELRAMKEAVGPAAFHRTVAPALLSAIKDLTASTPKSDTVECTLCGPPAKISRTDYAAHIATHEDE